MGLSEQPWATRAVVELGRCRPPLHELSTWTDGLAVLRWLLHRVLPYPCCLLGVPELALRLRVEVAWLAENLQTGQRLRDAVESTRYRGLLEEFLEHRWWWAGWESLLRSGPRGEPNSIPDLHALLEHLAGVAPKPLSIAQPVLAYNANGRFVSIEPRANCVRILPDYWPAYADEAWAKIEDAKNDDAVMRLVIPSDVAVVEG